MVTQRHNDLFVYEQQARHSGQLLLQLLTSPLVFRYPCCASMRRSSRCPFSSTLVWHSAFPRLLLTPHGRLANVTMKGDEVFAIQTLIQNCALQLMIQFFFDLVRILSFILPPSSPPSGLDLLRRHVSSCRPHGKFSVRVTAAAPISFPRSASGSDATSGTSTSFPSSSSLKVCLASNSAGWVTHHRTAFYCLYDSIFGLYCPLGTDETNLPGIRMARPAFSLVATPDSPSRTSATARQSSPTP